MNNVLQSGYDQLRAEEKRNLRQRLIDSPRAILLLDFLEERKGKKFNTVDAVNTVYNDERDEEFTTLRNRFFKLRKHIIETLGQGGEGAPTNAVLLPLEEELYKCRQLIGANHFTQAGKQLKALITECKRLNIFELLPEAYNQLVYTNLAMNNFKELESNLKNVDDSSKLLDDLRTMQIIARRAYLGAISRDTDEVTKHLQSMRRIVLRRSAYPRFELFYHFAAITNTPSTPGYSGKGHARHLASMKKLTAKFPEMPAGNYEPNGPALMQFYLLVAEGSHQFMRGDVHSCYSLFKESWEIMERIPNLKLRKSESSFRNRIAIEIATGRFRDAVKTAHDLIEFQKENKNEEKRMNGYAELAVIYSYAYPVLKCPDPEFLARQLKAFTALLKREKSRHLGDGLSTQAIFAFLNKDWKLSASIMKSEIAQNIFTGMHMPVYNELLIMNPSTPPEKVKELKKRMQSMLDKSLSSDRVYALKRALSLLKILEEEMS
jgi:hypothetical protein